ncbi:MAG: helix-turn-helix domain-containing protein [Asticcacaulis sp.]
MRGLDVMSAVANGVRNLPDLSAVLGLTRSTTHRLATTLVEQRFLNFTPRIGYSLGPKLLELGHLAAGQMNLPRIAHDYLVQLSQDSGDNRPPGRARRHHGAVPRQDFRLAPHRDQFAHRRAPAAALDRPR